MKPIYTQPHIFLWLSVPFILLLGLFDFGESIDINIYDSYFIMANWDLAMLIAIYFGLLGLIYWVLIKSGFLPFPWLTVAHLILTIDISFFIWLVLFFDWFSPNDVTEIVGISLQTKVIMTCLGLFAAGQLLFASNIILNLIKRKSAHNS
jgi:hypothetical protein